MLIQPKRAVQGREPSWDRNDSSHRFKSGRRHRRDEGSIPSGGLMIIQSGGLELRPGIVMASKHRKTFEAIYANPVRANIAWTDAVSMFERLGATVQGLGGSIFEVDLRGVKATLHKPHPGNELSKSRVRAIRTFLDQTGVNSDDL